MILTEPLFDPDKNSLSEGAAELLEYLVKSGYKLCLIAKKSNEEREGLISELGLPKYFLKIKVVEPEKTGEDFLECADIMDLNPQEIAVIGDKIKKEILIGNRVGMITIWFKSGKFSSELPEDLSEEPRYIITKLKDVINFLS